MYVFGSPSTVTHVVHLTQGRDFFYTETEKSFQNIVRQIGALFTESVFELFLIFQVFGFDSLHAYTGVAEGPLPCPGARVLYCLNSKQIKKATRSQE